MSNHFYFGNNEGVFEDISWTELYYICPPPNEETESYVEYDDDIEAKIEDLANAFSRLSISAPSTSTSSSRRSSLSLATRRPLDELFDQLMVIAREAAARSQYEVEIPPEILTRVFELHRRNERAQNSQASSLSSLPPINVYRNPTPRDRRYQRAASIAAYVVIILMIRAGTQYFWNRR